MDNLTIWHINSQELEFDITEAESSERYETALENLRKDIPKVKPSGIATSTFIRAYCKAQRKLYDSIFGEGTAEKIFDGIPESIRRYNAVYASFLGFVGMQTSTMRDEIDEIEKKYLPEKETKGRAKK